MMVATLQSSSTQPSVDHILSPMQLQALQDAYAANRGALASVPAGIYNTLYPGGATLYNGIIERFYCNGTPVKPPLGPLSEKQRERCIIAMLASQGANLTLAVHIYWGLAVGVPTNDIAETLLLAGAFSGFNNYSTALNVMAKTLTELARLASAGTTDPVDVARAIIALFPS